MHFRGPLYLKQFAVYYPAPVQNYNKRSHAHQHLGRQHAHHKKAMVVQTITQTVVVDQYGSVLWPKPTSHPHEHHDTDENSNNGDYGKDKDDDKKDKPTSEYTGDITLPGGSWVRKAYYDATSQTVEGLVFMNHRGGQGSGVWDK